MAISRRVSGKELRDLYVDDVRALSLGLVRMSGTSLCFGPFEILRFGRPKVTRSGVDWPIEGGLATGAAGGAFAVKATSGRLVGTLDGYRPRIPVAVYAITQLPIHHLVTRLHLLRVRGRVPMPGVPVAPTRRAAAAAIDIGLFALVALVAGKRRRPAALAAVAAGYHVACWSISGRTLGGLITRQRVVSVDGSRVSAGQALIRLFALPMAALRMRAVHDEIAGPEVVAD